MEELNEKLNKYFAGKVVRKDLTKKIKEGANVPVYVLEYLLGMYCATNDEQAINESLKANKNHGNEENGFTKKLKSIILNEK